MAAMVGRAERVHHLLSKSECSRNELIIIFDEMQFGLLKKFSFTFGENYSRQGF